MTRAVAGFEPPEGLPPLRRSFVAAVAWRVAAELVRRHDLKFGLRVIETHPGGGQYDCISLTMARAGAAHVVHLAAFNLGSGRVTVFHPIGSDGSAQQWRSDFFAEFALRQDEPRAVVDRVEALIGLPRAKKLPPASVGARCARLLAGVMEIEAFAREPLRSECGWLDSSGMDGCSVRPWLVTAFPEFASSAGGAGEMRRAARVWRVGGVALDFGSGTAVKLAKPEQRSVLLGPDEWTAVEWLVGAARRGRV